MRSSKWRTIHIFRPGSRRFGIVQKLRLVFAAIILTSALASCGASGVSGNGIEPLSDMRKASPRFDPSPLPILTDRYPSKSGVFLGATCGLYANVSCSDFATIFRRTIALGTVYTTWDQDLATFIADNDLGAWETQGMIPEITWEPRSDFSTITYSGINSGTYDAYITTSADELKAFGQPIFLRPFHEFNGSWMPWSLNSNGADATADADFIQAWRRMRRIFREQGATNVKFIWCFANATVPKASWNYPTAAYPGDSYVDWIGFDGYNRGNLGTGMPWKSFDSTIGAAYQEAIAVSPELPIIAAELASTEWGDDGTMKAAWVDQMFSELHPAATDPYPNLRVVSWFETDDTRFLYDSRSTDPVYQHFVMDIRQVGPHGFPYFRSNGTALFGITSKRL